MQNTNNKYNLAWQEFFIAIVIGLCSGASLFLFIQALSKIEIFHQQIANSFGPIYLVGLPIVLGLLYLLKIKSLYFPTKISELIEWRQDSSIHWSPWMSIFQFIGTSLSHLVGASVGREGTAVLITAGIVRNLKLQWSYWGPVAMGIGFSSILGNWWIGVIFVFELYSTNMRQKYLTLLGSISAFLFMQQLNVPHLFDKIDIQANPSFFSTFFFILVAGVLSGWIMRIYKSNYFKLQKYFKTKSLVIKIFLAAILAAFLWHPMMWPYHSLGISYLQSALTAPKLFSDVVIKLVVTLISVTLGFWGGEFIPLIYAGAYFGNVLSQFLGFDLLLGTVLTVYIFFAGATRLKWTSYLLTVSLFGFSWFFWSYFLISLSVSFSGKESIYKSKLNQI